MLLQIMMQHTYTIGFMWSHCSCKIAVVFKPVETMIGLVIGQGKDKFLPHSAIAECNKLFKLCD